MLPAPAQGWKSFFRIHNVFYHDFKFAENSTKFHNLLSLYTKFGPQEIASTSFTAPNVISLKICPFLMNDSHKSCPLLEIM